MGNWVIRRGKDLNKERAVEVSYRLSNGRCRYFFINPHQLVYNLLGGHFVNRSFCVIAFAEGIRQEGKHVLIVNSGRTPRFCVVRRPLHESVSNEVLIYRFVGRCVYRGWWRKHIVPYFAQYVRPEDRFDVLLEMATKAAQMKKGSHIFRR